MKWTARGFLPVLAIATIAGCNKAKTDEPSDNQPREAGSQTARIEARSNPTRSTLRFQDDSRSHPDLSRFKQDLLAALDAGDQAKVLSAFSEIIEFDPGHSKGKDGVVEIWGLDGSAEKLEPLKTLLSTLLSKGGCLKREEGVDSTYTAPFTNCVPEDFAKKCQESGCGVIVESGADLYASPSPDVEAIHRLEPFEVIPTSLDTLCTPDFLTCEWTRITTFEGKTGFIPKSRLATQGDGLVWLVKETGGWKIRVLRGKGIPQDET